MVGWGLRDNGKSGSGVLGVKLWMHQVGHQISGVHLEGGLDICGHHI